MSKCLTLRHRILINLVALVTESLREGSFIMNDQALFIPSYQINYLHAFEDPTFKCDISSYCHRFCSQASLLSALDINSASHNFLNNIFHLIFRYIVEDFTQKNQYHICGLPKRPF